MAAENSTPFPPAPRVRSTRAWAARRARRRRPRWRCGCRCWRLTSGTCPCTRCWSRRLSADRRRRKPVPFTGSAKVADKRTGRARTEPTITTTTWSLDHGQGQQLAEKRQEEPEAEAGQGQARHQEVGSQDPPAGLPRACLLGQTRGDSVGHDRETGDRDPRSCSPQPPCARDEPRPQPQSGRWASL